MRRCRIWVISVDSSVPCFSIIVECFFDCCSIDSRVIGLAGVSLVWC